MAGPWSPDWRPDDTGRRLVAIHAARRGAFVAALIFGMTVAIAVHLAPGVVVSQPELRAGFAAIVAAGSVPGLALLGAVLTPSALDDRTSAFVAGLAMGIAAPTAAAVSAMIGVFVSVTFLSGTGSGFEMAGRTLEAGVHAAFGVAPLIVVAAGVWVLAVRRLAPPPAADAGESEATP